MVVVIIIMENAPARQASLSKPLLTHKNSSENRIDSFLIHVLSTALCGFLDVINV